VVPPSPTVRLVYGRVARSRRIVAARSLKTASTQPDYSAGSRKTVSVQPNHAAAPRQSRCEAMQRSDWVVTRRFRPDSAQHLGEIRQVLSVFDEQSGSVVRPQRGIPRALEVRTKIRFGIFFNPLPNRLRPRRNGGGTSRCRGTEAGSTTEAKRADRTRHASRLRNRRVNSVWHRRTQRIPAS
jgi:hypothetical protein